MKKLFLVVLAAGLFVACGNKTAETENVDSTAMDTVLVEEVDSVVEEAVVEEPVVAENTTKATTTTKKEEDKTIKEVAKETGTSLAKQAIQKGGEEASKQIDSKSINSRGNR